MSVDFEVRGQQGMDFFTVIMDYGLEFCPEAMV